MNIIRCIPPAQFLFLLLVSLFFLSYLLIIQMLSQPWLGIQFSVDMEETNGLLITDVAPHIESQGINVGQQVLAISGENDRIALTPNILISPDALPSFEALNHYLNIQQRLSAVLQESYVTLELLNHHAVTIEIHSYHPLSSIPAIYFIYLLAIFFSTTMGFLLWRYRPNFMVTRMVLLGNTGVFIYYVSVMLMYRELALPANTLYRLAMLDLLGVNLFVAAYLAVFMIYPLKIFNERYTYVVLAIFLLVFMSQALQWFELPFHAFLVHFLLAGILFYYLSWQQWLKSNNHPIERSIIKLFALTMVIPTVIIVSLWIIPVVLQQPTIISHELARLTFFPILLGWALAIFRYRLFNVEHWWLSSVSWLGGGLLLLTLDIILVSVLNLDYIPALTLALFIAGFLYFPLRQLVLNRFLPTQDNHLQTVLPQLIQSLETSANDQDYQKVWKKVLLDRFQPVSIKTYKAMKTAYNKPQFAEEGLLLYVPDVVANNTYALSGKRQGNALFNQHDEQVADSLLALAKAILHASQVREEATLAERKRIMRDLHDSLGAKLLAMVQRYRGQTVVEEARDALQLLRDTVHLSTHKEGLYLSDLLGEWRTETRERTEIIEAQLHWQEVGIHDEHIFSPAKILLLRSFLRESVSNALKHAQPKHLFIEIVCAKQTLDFLVMNDYPNTQGLADPQAWHLGFGLSHLRERLVRAKGSLQLYPDIYSGYNVTVVKASLPYC
ncbi:MAG: sensor histidine kinase [bacterium]